MADAAESWTENGGARNASNVSSPWERRALSGFTLIEMLVVIAIIAILVALLLPAVQQAREAARRTECRMKMMQIILALQNYHDAQASLPAGSINDSGPIRNEAKGYHHSWYTMLLPYIDEQNVYARIDRTVSIYDPANAEARGVVLPLLICPSDPAARTSTSGNAGLSNYAGIHHPLEAPIDTTNHGVLFLNSRVQYSDVRDGVSHTLFVSEIKRSAADLGWASGTRATLRNAGSALNRTAGGSPYYNDPNAPPESAGSGAQFVDPSVSAEAQNDAALQVGGFGSYHTGGAQFALGDGSVRFISENINVDIYQKLMDRADGSVNTNTF